MLLKGNATVERFKYWGRKWRIVIMLDDGSTIGHSDGTTTTTGTGLDVSSMRVLFRVKRNIQLSKQTATLTIYNLNRNTEKIIISRATKVFIEAGYADGVNYGSIFSGDIWQTLRGKDGKVNYTLVIKAISDQDAMNWGLSKFAIRRGSNYRDLLDSCAKNSNVPLEIGNIPEGWGEQIKFSRGFSTTGNVKDILKGIADSTNSIISIDNGKINVYTLEVPKIDDEVFDLNYKSGLIGQPVQTKEGVNFSCLLNPRIAINTWVHINNAYIQEIETDLGENLIPSLDVDGLYRVVETEFVGDTRGNDWQMNNLGITQSGVLPTFLADTQQEGI